MTELFRVLNRSVVRNLFQIQPELAWLQYTCRPILMNLIM